MITPMVKFLIAHLYITEIFCFLYRFSGSRAILSGPAGGVVGYAITTYHRQTNLPVIGFDMGGKHLSHCTTENWLLLYQIIFIHYPGTSTDVSRFAGDYEHVFETTTAGVTIQAPQVKCHL